ncbi:DNA-binding NtrC family response regulator [Natranaerovirga pectinivora]|uniref:Stage 0 sporulation protein A homolog n=1 Tax=Natranaerovirga pectinivora TaxID=682400 RepID=A0A4R3MPM5_9FIRM|nr:sigma-54 dependent transcriptional regulator [Natranaerovirga pectinivora]TCT15569.1 DNA-binding NtrC family response regulator [Natranaerovirga pectinivora]
MNRRILIVDDEKNMRWALKKAFESETYELYEAENGEEAIQQFNKYTPDLVLLDIRMPKLNGLEVLKKLQEDNKNVAIIMITAYGDVESALEAMKLGALDYITKPFEIEELKGRIRKVFESEMNKSQDRITYEDHKIVGNSSKIINVLHMVQRVANTTATVLIQGESGTGKELIARSLHQISDRKEKPYITVNCGALPEALLESELFGHEKGAFTGAINKNIGRFERAEGGTLFLDEIGELSLPMQVKLLRALQEKEIERVGGKSTIKIDVRVVTATNRNLIEMIKKGTFREDLYYRLNVVSVELPPLRERKEDIPELINFFIQKYAVKFNRDVYKMSDIAIELLKRYAWPGNIRELENIIERAVILSLGETITPEVLPREIIGFQQENKRFELPEEGIDLEEVEKNLILQAVEKAKGNQTEAAKLLGITRQTLIYRMNKYELK